MINWKNKEELKKYNKIYRENNKEAINKQRKEYRLKNKEKIKLNLKEYYKKYPYMMSFYKARNRCNNKHDIGYKSYGGRGIKFLMIVKDFKALWFRDKAWLLKNPSIDRIDNNKNYSIENCRFIELSQNIGNRNKIHRKQGGRCASCKSQNHSH